MDKGKPDCTASSDPEPPVHQPSIFPASSRATASALPAFSRDCVRAAASAIPKAQRRHEKTSERGKNMTSSPMVVTSKRAAWEGKTTDLRDALSDGG